MSNRLNQEREAKLQPERIEYAIKMLESPQVNKVIIYKDSTRIDFLHNGNKISLYPYSGWWSGKGVGSGRGINELLKQLAK